MRGPVEPVVRACVHEHVFEHLSWRCAIYSHPLFVWSIEMGAINVLRFSLNIFSCVCVSVAVVSHCENREHSAQSTLNTFTHSIWLPFSLVLFYFYLMCLWKKAIFNWIVRILPAIRVALQAIYFVNFIYQYVLRCRNRPTTKSTSIQPIQFISSDVNENV